jgi:hypothetical protein
VHISADFINPSHDDVLKALNLERFLVHPTGKRSRPVLD